MPRRETNIRKRKDGRWEARYIKGKNDSGKSIYASVYGKTYTEVKEKRKQCIIQQNKTKTKLCEFTTIYHNWLFIIEKKVKASTYSRYKYVGDHYILDYFSKYKIDEINTSLIEQFIYSHIKSQENQEGYSVSTIKIIITVLKQIINYANSSDYHIACKIENIQLKNEILEPRFLSRDEQSIIEKELDNLPNNIALGIWLGLYTGLRLGELCALKWSDVIWSNQYIHINKTMQRIANYDTHSKYKTKIIIDSPKSKNSQRNIPIPEFCFQKLLAVKPEQNDSYILTNTNKYMEPRVFEYHFDNFMKKCKLEDVHFHTLRHTFTTRCIESGFEIKALSEILGHSSVSFTLDRYGHCSMDIKTTYMNKLLPIV